MAVRVTPSTARLHHAPEASLPESSSGWYSVRQFCQRNPAFTESSVRSYIFDADKHGLEDAILRAGRKVLVHEERWFKAFQRRQSNR